MSEKRVYQDKMLNSKKEIVVFNWERGEGKTYSVFEKIIKSRNGKFLCISNNQNMNMQLKHFIDDYISEATSYSRTMIEEVIKDKSIITIKYKNEKVIEINYGSLNSMDDLRGLRDIKCVFFDECVPSKEIIKLVKEMGTEQIYIMMTNDDIEYIDSRNSTQIKDFYDKQIEELMIEYTETPKNKNTTLSRENILKQIKVLQDMKRGN